MVPACHQPDKVLGDRKVNANRPDIVTKNDQTKICQLIDMSVPSDKTSVLKTVKIKESTRTLKAEYGKPRQRSYP
jgi:hypothetical protein